MRPKLIIALVAVVAVALIARGCSERNDDTARKVGMANAATTDAGSQPVEFSLSAADDEGFDLPEREEIRQKRKLTRGTEVFVVGLTDFGVDTDHTQVFVIGIDGRVKVETADTDAAEVLIVRSARKREDLQRQKVEINDEGKNGEDLYIRIGSAEESDHGPTVRRRLKRLRRLDERYPDTSSSPEPAPEIRQRVILRLPRQAGLEIREFGGDVTIGGGGGHLGIFDVTGNVRVINAGGPINGWSISGDIDITFAPLKANIVRIGGDINGDVDLRFEGEVNVDLTPHNVNGAIKLDFPNVETSVRETEQGRILARPTASKARIGIGEFRIEISDVNGNVTLSKAGNIDASVSKAAAKSEQRQTK
ncbi:MAG TPA: hypothetical protein VJ810_29205 [Blastocatellia bacterium]|nr:hypothetical protein [Blastocatellia bacterium]